jgi:hypothetical protein
LAARQVLSSGDFSILWAVSYSKNRGYIWPGASAREREGGREIEIEIKIEREMRERSGAGFDRTRPNQVAAEADRLLGHVLGGETVAVAAARLLAKGTVNPADAEASKAFVVAAEEAAASARCAAEAADAAAARPLIPIRPERLRMEAGENVLAVVTQDIAGRMQPMEDGYSLPSLSLSSSSLLFSLS